MPKSSLKSRYGIFLLVVILLIVLLVVMVMRGSESYMSFEAEVTDPQCLKLTPNPNTNQDFYGLPYSIGQQYANAYACQNLRKRHEKLIGRADCPNGTCNNPVDYTGCSWFLPPDIKPDDVSEEDFTQAWANYWACVSNAGADGGPVCRGNVCKTNNLDFERNSGVAEADGTSTRILPWPAIARDQNNLNKYPWDSNLNEAIGQTGPYDRLWLLGVKKPDVLKHVITVLKGQFIQQPKADDLCTRAKKTLLIEPNTCNAPQTFQDTFACSYAATCTPGSW